MKAVFHKTDQVWAGSIPRIPKMTHSVCLSFPGRAPEPIKVAAKAGVGVAVPPLAGDDHHRGVERLHRFPYFFEVEVRLVQEGEGHEVRVDERGDDGADRERQERLVRRGDRAAQSEVSCRGGYEGGRSWGGAFRGREEGGVRDVERCELGRAGQVVREGKRAAVVVADCNAGELGGEWYDEGVRGRGGEVHREEGERAERRQARRREERRGRVTDQDHALQVKMVE